MSIIYSYPEQGQLNADDMFIGTSAVTVGGKQKNITRNFTVQQIADFINQGAGFVDPLASDFQIPVFNQGGKKITGSIMSQNIYPAGSAITIAGSLTVNTDLTASGNILLGSGSNTIVLQSPTTLGGPIKDSSNTLGVSNQILISNSLGNLVWQNYEAGLTYEGTWNASTNTPTLTSGQGVSGHFYIVSVAGNENLDGNNDWHVGDWAVFFDAGGAGTAGWQKIDNTSVLTGSGTANTFAMWTATETLNDSLLSQDAGATKVIVDGLLEIKGDGTSQDGRIKLNCWNNNHGVTIQSPPHSAAQSWTWILPQTTGGANDVLTTDGNTPSQLSWTTPPSGTVTGNGTENYVTKWSAGGAGIQNSTIFDNGTKVGIGTDNPGALLSVRTTATSGNEDLARFSRVGASAEYEVLKISRAAMSDTEFLAAQNITLNADYDNNHTSASSNIILKTDNAEKMRITHDGNVGIGTDSPGAKLHVDFTSDNDGLRIQNSNRGHNYLLTTAQTNAQHFSIYDIDNDANLMQIGYAQARIYTNNTERLRITSTGNVGIGTDSPSEKLQISATMTSSPTSNIFLDVDGTNVQGGGGSIAFGTSATAGTMDQFNAKITGTRSSLDNGSSDLSFFTTNQQNSINSALRMIIKDSGNVGIGTSSPIPKLHVYQNDTEVDTLTGVTIEQDGAGDAALSFLLTGTKRWKLGIDNSDSDKFKISDSTNLSSSNKLTIDTSGNVGIGTSSPAVSLDISATDAVQMPVGVTGDRPVTGVSNGMLRYNSTNNGFEGYINGNWGSIGGGSSGGLIFRGTFNASTGDIAGGGNLTTGTNRVAIAIGDMYIVDTAGDFYGDTSKPLNVGDEVICVLDAAVGTSDINDWNAIASGSGGAITGSGTPNYIPKFTANTVVSDSSIFNDAAGNVGIGTTSPGSALHISNTTPEIYLEDSNNTADAKLLANNGNLGLFSDVNNEHASSIMYFNVDGSERMRIASNGNVGIGTDDPREKLHVYTGSSGGTANVAADEMIVESDGNTGITISSPSTTTGTIAFGDNDVSLRGALRYDHNSDSMTFRVASAESMRIASDGNVGIGTTSPDTKLHVESTSNANSPILTIENDNAKQIELGVVRSIAGIQPNTSFLAYDNDFRFIAGAGSTNEVMRIDSNGKVGIGTDQPEVSLDLSANNDAILVPNGATTDRPTGILPGMIRYNTTTSEFEGYTGTLNVSGSWGALGGGGTPAITKDLFQVTTAQSIFTLTAVINTLPAANYVNIFIDGVYQNSGTYTVATATGTTTVTLNTAAPVGTSVEIISTT